MVGRVVDGGWDGECENGDSGKGEWILFVTKYLRMSLTLS